MKKYFYLISCFVLLIILTGCTKNAKMAVEEYLDKYNSLDNGIISDMNSVIDMENLSDANRETYSSIFKKQYTDLQYSIIDEEYNGDEAIITVKVTVYDYYKIQKEASFYLANHADEFNDENGEYSVEKYLKYKLDKMKMATDRIDYTIDFYVVKNDSRWEVTQLANSDLEKIHGIYNYES